jgi:hypothetical protein
MAVLGFGAAGTLRESAPRVRAPLPTPSRSDSRAEVQSDLVRRAQTDAPVRSRHTTVALRTVFFVHLTIALLVAANHEPWRDEADIWLFGRDAPPAEWWSFLRHSGHPGLWHLLVAGLVHSGLPYASMTFANVAIVSLGIAIFLRFARLPLVMKLLLPLGVLPLYEYGVVARSYGLSFMLSMAACATLVEIRARRDARDLIPAAARSGRMTGAPATSDASTANTNTARLSIALGAFLALLANTNVHSLILAAGFGLFWIVDERSHRSTGERAFSRAALLGMSIAVAGGLAAIVQVLPPADPQFVERTWAPVRVLSGALMDAFFPRGGRWLGGILGTALLALCVPLARRDRALLAFWIVTVGGLCGVFLFVYPPYQRHAGFLWISAVCVLWIARSRDATSSDVVVSPRVRTAIASVFTLSLAFTAVEGVRLASLDLRKPFSASREAAEFVKTLDLDGAIVAAHPSTMGEAILPHLPIQKLYYPGIESMGSYLLWDSAYWLGVHVENTVALRRTRAAYPEPIPLVFITTSALERPEASGLTLRHRTEIPPRAFKDDEQYFIYTSDGVGVLPTQ